MPFPSRLIHKAGTHGTDSAPFRQCLINHGLYLFIGNAARPAAIEPQTTESHSPTRNRVHADAEPVSDWGTWRSTCARQDANAGSAGPLRCRERRSSSMCASSLSSIGAAGGRFSYVAPEHLWCWKA